MVDFSVLEKQLLAKGYTPEILATLRKSAKSFHKSPGPGTKNGDILAQASKADELSESTPASEQSSLITSKTIENRETELARLEQLKLLMEKKIADKYSTIEKLNAQLFGSENIETETEHLSSKVKLQNLEIAKITYGIDLALLMDCTGSMGSYIDMARQKMVEIIHFAQDIDPRAVIRIAFLGYRDINDRNSDRFIKVDFQTKDNISVLTDTLNSARAMGGGDGPEDIAGALNLALSLGWRSRTRLVVIISDCPCHGSQYHSLAGDYPKGDPFGLVTEDLLIQLASESVNIVFGRITTQTDQMTRIFQKTLEECGRTMRIINASSGPDVFLQELKETMTSSFREAVHP